MDYAVLKLVHVSCASISYVLFVIRGIWMIRNSSWLQRRWVRVMPHVVDTILLASAVTMVIIIWQYPLVAPWLTAKVIALLVYVALGMVALRRGKSKRVRVAAWIAAQTVFAYIVAVAFTRTPLPWI